MQHDRIVCMQRRPLKKIIVYCTKMYMNSFILGYYIILNVKFLIDEPLDFIYMYYSS